MTDGTGEKLSTREVIGIAVAVGCSYGNCRGALRGTVLTGVGEAALLLSLFSGEGNDFGVD